jgi:formylglycine-generating enzyme required for sulfatase activity
MGSNPSQASKDPNCPVDTISEGDAVEFCNRVDEMTGKPTRLPTEAEWEYACRAGATTKYFFGDDPGLLEEYAWYEKNSGGKTQPVGQKKPNRWGLYDTLGNVCERVSDTYDKNYYAKGPQVDPTGPSQGIKSQIEYVVNVPKAGEYALSAQVVTVNYNQRLVVTANGSRADITLPFSCGDWQESNPVTIALKEGANTLAFYRDNPPQYGVAIKSFKLVASPRREPHASK